MRDLKIKDILLLLIYRKQGSMAWLPFVFLSKHLCPCLMKQKMYAYYARQHNLVCVCLFYHSRGCKESSAAQIIMQPKFIGVLPPSWQRKCYCWGLAAKLATWLQAVSPKVEWSCGREGREIIQAFWSSGSKNLSVCNRIWSSNIQSESPPWCRMVCISALLSYSAWWIRARLTSSQQWRISAWDGSQTLDRFSLRVFLCPDTAVIIIAGEEKDLRLFAGAERPFWGRKAMLGSSAVCLGAWTQKWNKIESKIYSWSTTLGRRGHLLLAGSSWIFSGAWWRESEAQFLSQGAKSNPLPEPK